jgi:hypothetical protein
LTPTGYHTLAVESDGKRGVTPARADAVVSESAFPFPSLDELALETPLLSRNSWLDESDAIAGPLNSKNRGGDTALAVILDMDTDMEMAIPDTHLRREGKKREHSLCGNVTPDLVRHRSKNQK